LPKNRFLGDLVNGEINIAIAAMTMTSERAEVVDFVAPYFDQSGISIITRLPVKPKSLFKFIDGEQRKTLI
jgi:ionotropic glutamate receptor